MVIQIYVDFDYARISTDQLNKTQKFAILIVSKKYGTTGNHKHKKKGTHHTSIT